MIDVTDGNSIYYYHFDGLGSVVALSNNSGNVVERYGYDVFGEPNRVSNINNPYLFTGRNYDSETGLYYYRARYYSPTIGRFLQTDPIGYEDGLIWYAYCGNDPVNWNDPWGLDALLDQIENGKGPVYGYQIASDLYNPAPPPTSEEIHEALNNTSLIPCLSTASDIINAGKYFSEGNKKGAALYVAGVALPFVSGPMLRVGERGVMRITSDALAKARQAFEKIKPNAWMAEAARNSEKYTVEQLARIKNGLAPIGRDGFPMEIHHRTPLSEGGANTMDNFDFKTRTDHRLGPNYKENHPNLP